MTPDLRDAYLEVERLVRGRSQNFRRASMLLPVDQRRAMWAAYAFFRKTDDLVDEHSYTPAQLQEWCDRALLPPEAQTDLILMAWSDVRRRYHVEDRHVQDLISGIAQDTVQKTYATLPELLEYCYRVASCAGLLTIPIIGLAHGVTMPEATPYAIKLGQALQLTDILADVGEDVDTGRVYLPADELAQNGLTAEEILARRADTPVRAVIERLSGYARGLYRQAWPGFAMSSGTGRAAVGMGTLVFRSYLDELERRGFDSVTRAVKPSGGRRLSAVLTQWPEVAFIKRSQPKAQLDRHSAN